MPGCASACRAGATTSCGLTTMPSPPPAVRSSHHATAAASLAGSSRSTSMLAGRAERVGVGGGEPAAMLMCQGCGSSACTSPFGGEHLERREREAVEPVDRPAVAAVRVDEPLGHRRAVRRRAAASGARVVDASGRRRRARRARPRKRRGRGRADRRVLRAQQLLGLGRPRQQLAVEHEPVGRELVPQPGRGRRASRTRSSSAASSVASVKNASAGARVDRARRVAVGDAEPRGRRPSASRHTTTTAREPMCFSSHTTLATPSRRKASNASVGCSSTSGRVARRRRRHRRAAGTRASAGRRRSGSSPRAPRPRSPRGS